MTHDDARPAALPRWREVGTGFTLLALCDFCGHRRQQLGSRRVGPFKRFKCAHCVNAEGKR